MQNYITLEGYWLKVEGNSAMVDCWNESNESWEPLDTSASFLQSLLDEQYLPFTVGKRLGWRELESEHLRFGYFAIHRKEV